MPSHEDYAAFLASILQRPDDRVIGVIEPAKSSPATAASQRIKQPAEVCSDGRDYTITPITPLHRQCARAALPQEIAEGLAALDDMAPPAGFTAERWSGIVKAMVRFAYQYAGEAVELGWTAEDLFGLNPYAPSTRYDGRGLATLLSESDRILSLSADAAVIEGPSGSKLTFPRDRSAAPSVPAWNLKRGV
jgi:hypothetical protein